MKRKHAFFFALVITLIISINVYLIRLPINSSNLETVTITRAIDGDTIESGSEKIRLLNINTPEKNKKGYMEAKEYLQALENTTVQIERTGTDKYGRTLARLYSPEYINLEIVKEGLATKFLVQENELKEFEQAESNAIKEEKGIWIHSQYHNCFTAEINAKEETIIIESTCGKINFEGWLAKDESRKEYNFPNIISDRVILNSFKGKDEGENIYWNSAGDIWNNDRDTFYLFDDKNNLVYFRDYGY